MELCRAVVLGVTTMVSRRMATTIIALAATLGVTLGSALGLASAAYAFDEAKYPDLSGQWHRIGPDRFDGGTNRDAPLTPEYRAIYEGPQERGRQYDRRPDAELPGARHAAGHDGVCADGDHRHSRHRAYPDREHPRLAPHPH